MRVSGFTYLRNSITLGYPFLASIKSILPVCDEFIIAVGKGDDGTREAIAALNSSKIKIIDTIWDNENLRTGGRLLAEQCNVALKQITGDWGFHLQSDEVVHERDLDKISKAMEDNLNNKEVEGFLLGFHHFFGDYDHIGVTRRWHRHEIRIVRNLPGVYSYNDSMGFRIYPNDADYANNTNSRKLNVKKIDASVYHYSYARNPKILIKKGKEFDKLWHDDEWLNKKYRGATEFDFSKIDYLTNWKGDHPLVMKEIIASQDWDFDYDPSVSNFSAKERFLFNVEKLTGWRIGEYKNYNLI